MLKPCPFCGAKAKLTPKNCMNRFPAGTGVMTTTGITCSGCGIVVRYVGPREFLIAAWNRRHKEVA